MRGYGWCLGEAQGDAIRRTIIDKRPEQLKMGKQVSVGTKAKLREAANSHMMRLKQNPERVTSYFQNRRVKYGA